MFYFYALLVLDLSAVLLVLDLSAVLLVFSLTRAVLLVLSLTRAVLLLFSVRCYFSPCGVTSLLRAVLLTVFSLVRCVKDVTCGVTEKT